MEEATLQQPSSTSCSSSSASNALQFLLVCYNLKKNKRMGWVRKGVHLPESISDHMYFMALMAWLINDKPDKEGNKPLIDKEKCIKMALVHDLAEAIVGDITPHDGITKEEKYKLEHNAMAQLEKILQTSSNQDPSLSSIGSEINSLWLEYETGKSEESQIVKQLDKFEMCLQAFVYQKEQNMNLNEFFQSCQGCFKHSQIIDWVSELQKHMSQLGNTSTAAATAATTTTTTTTATATTTTTTTTTATTTTTTTN